MNPCSTRKGLTAGDSRTRKEDSRSCLRRPSTKYSAAERGARIEVWNRPNNYGWTPLSIAAGHRAGNFKPSPETIAALERVLQAAGVPPAAPVAPKDVGKKKGD